jgi:hypothetical protein
VVHVVDEASHAPLVPRVEIHLDEPVDRVDGRRLSGPRDVATDGVLAAVVGDQRLERARTPASRTAARASALDEARDTGE